ncbi:MAG: hypothetical protein ACLS3C_11860 [Oscillospiraceae bacterium]
MQEVVRNIVLQLAMLHGYTGRAPAVGLFWEGEQELFGWLRWLPHRVLAGQIAPGCWPALRQTIRLFCLICSTYCAQGTSRDALQSGLRRRFRSMSCLCTEPEKNSCQPTPSTAI